MEEEESQQQRLNFLLLHQLSGKLWQGGDVESVSVLGEGDGCLHST